MITRKNFLQKWRNCLNKAERLDLEVVEGTSDDLFKTSIKLSKEMGNRKNLITVVSDARYARRKEKPQAASELIEQRR